MRRVSEKKRFSEVLTFLMRFSLLTFLKKQTNTHKIKQELWQQRQIYLKNRSLSELERKKEAYGRLSYLAITPSMMKSSNRFT